jgi:hypothetical protein
MVDVFVLKFKLYQNAKSINNSLNMESPLGHSSLDPTCIACEYAPCINTGAEAHIMVNVFVLKARI